MALVRYHRLQSRNLIKLTCKQIVYFDKMHVSQEGGLGSTINGMRVFFPQCTEGIYGSNSATLNNKEVCATYKYMLIYILSLAPMRIQYYMNHVLSIHVLHTDNKSCRIARLYLIIFLVPT